MEKKIMFVKRHCKIFEIHYCALLLIDTQNSYGLLKTAKSVKPQCIPNQK